MKKVDLIVTAPHIYTMKGEGVGYEEKKALVVDGSKIIDIVDIDKLSDQYEAEEQLDMTIIFCCLDLSMLICTPAAISCVDWLRILTTG